MTFGKFGDSKRTITTNKDLSVINCGCFSNDYNKFKEAVLGKYGGSYGTYKNLIIILDALQTSINKQNEK
jgi:hypothetical protein